MSVERSDPGGREPAGTAEIRCEWVTVADVAGRIRKSPVAVVSWYDRVGAAGGASGELGGGRPGAM
ncbi:hypothetical protein KQH42_12365 [Streptomyces sp. CHA1]|uniref:hypothetical protein n=1 Tax=Streptomyces TaxID=1883 RepID=UPI000F552A5B|nr:MULTISPECIES: hypothetical protein [unclassified Streptomyces]WSB22053.1 hypothetical protein OHB02_18415 [Streptomyces albidoflavus]MBT3160926.1 hypothetical protein [Streptomyces sp. G11C]MCO6701171.1 hypothetical protein [Streptomyces sp. CHB9.2]MCO6707427.1 hypothetical protein [Streptomyces sp. CHA3]MCO6713164.1 hypothetical protein [Streptomyces sp. CHB19.2]